MPNDKVSDIIKQNDIHNKRSYLVVKANELVQKSRYTLTEQEFKILQFVISKIKEDDTEFLETIVSVKELCDIFDIKYDSTNYSNLQSSIEKLNNKSFWIDTEPKKAVLFYWFQYVEIDKDKLTVTLRLNDLLKPYLLNLQGNTTIYQLKNILPMSGHHAPRLYEILKSYSDKGSYLVSIDELKLRLGLSEDSYSEYKAFNRRVITPAIQEINGYSDILVEVTPQKTARKTSHLLFTIEPNADNKVIGYMQKDYTKKTKRKKDNEDKSGG